MSERRIIILHLYVIKLLEPIEIKLIEECSKIIVCPWINIVAD